MDPFSSTWTLFSRHVPMDDEHHEPGQCDTGNEFDGQMGLRISAIFVILVGSLFGAWFPVFAQRHAGSWIPESFFFISKFFGSGVIIATAFVHLLAPAHEALSASCLTGPITEYPWVEGISLMAVFSLFVLEIVAMRYGMPGGHAHTHTHNHEHPTGDASIPLKVESSETTATTVTNEPATNGTATNGTAREGGRINTLSPGADHFGHARSHVDNSDAEHGGVSPESLAAQMTSIFILEFGVIFHSIFIGLTLAVAGEEFKILYIVLVFHQTFEGLGLGARLAMIPWPAHRKFMPYGLAIAYGLSTPIAIAAGLGVRTSYAPGSQTTLIVNGVFDSISAGILIYTGLVELMAHEFMFSPTMSKAPAKTVMSAIGLMALGAGLMALLGKWA
ncbi:ZIP zinc/iron transport family [Eremomyces bilateralis CBS 781.70]|uniref:ZIP zinc/iron transport family n=1 Tax=Eremomyces bilateralis CBS 781.70 TaxID=1392243 RepID=A0A6G1GHR7_9PEZI|nr:ZIP zinc/iron transport family [Eremomyces bilateralis CBS 781.70]KAF1817419.1 ZIP zinc/iron transport family [Eremomyces bilateralis CBS 781.70]